jgi:hypothetical protein
MLRLSGNLIFALMLFQALVSAAANPPGSPDSMPASDARMPATPLPGPTEFVTNVDGAANPEQIPRHVVVWSLFQQLQLDPPPHPGNFGQSVLTASVGLDPANADRLAAYAKRSLLDDQRYQQDVMRTFCASMTTDIPAKSLASKLEAVERATDQWREARVAALSTLLDAKAKESLDQWVDRQRRSMGISKVDYFKMLESAGARDTIALRAMQGCSALPARAPWVPAIRRKPPPI